MTHGQQLQRYSTPTDLDPDTDAPMRVIADDDEYHTMNTPPAGSRKGSGRQ